MNERTMQFRVGAMIVATFLITIILVLLFVGSGPMVRSGYTVKIRFFDAPGVTRHTPIRKNGVRIGRVTDVELAEQDTVVMVTAEIDRDRHIYSNEECRAVNSLLMGEAALEFVRVSPTTAATKEIQSGETIAGASISEPNRAFGDLSQQLKESMGDIRNTARDIDKVAVSLQQFLKTNDQGISKAIDQANITFGLLQDTLRDGRDILGDPQVRAQLKQTLKQLPEVLNSVQGTASELAGSMKSLRENLHNVEGLTKPLGERGESLVSGIDEAVKKLHGLTDQMLRFSEELNNPQGTVGQLIHDKELYGHLSHAARNLDELSRELRPIIENAQAFSDKIARHPEQLGVRGVIQRNPGIK